MKKTKVFLFGGDGQGWALDDDLALIRQALKGHIEESSLAECDVIHSVWWDKLQSISPVQLQGKRVICHISAEPRRYFGLAGFRRVRPCVGCWVTQSSQAHQQLKSLGIASRLIPYAVDTETFRPLAPDNRELKELRKRWNIPDDGYLIGSFQRDSEGKNVRLPKLMKGPDLFAEIVTLLWRRKLPVHVVLAGPRRHWLCAQLRKRGIPYTYVGTPTEEDDFELNTLPRETLNLLYNIIDLYLVASRSEGGPRSLLEGTAAACKTVSSRVGLAEDILEPDSIYDCLIEAADKIEQDISNNRLGGTIEPQQQRLFEHHTAERVSPLMGKLYDQIDSVPMMTSETGGQPARRKSGLLKRVVSGLRLASGKKARLSISLWHKFYQPPWGGGNQFMMCLRKGLLEQGMKVKENALHSQIDAYVLNSIHFDVDRFMELRKRGGIPVLHRIDGPIHLIRGFDREKDDKCFELNRLFAQATVLQSAWTYERIVEMGYQPVRPIIIHNTVDPHIFHRNGRAEFNPGRKVRLISSSWSDNPRKGGPTYKWIEDHLDWSRFDYTFVGQASERFSRIKQIDPVPSEKLAELLRQHDIYITASRNDPCSNAVIEALACGLPVLYLNDGGHPELVGPGGLPFNNEDEILLQLDQLAANYQTFQQVIQVPTLSEVTTKYLELLKEIASC